MNGPHSSIGCLCIGAANLDIRCAFDAPSKSGISNVGKITTMAGGAALNTARILASHDVMTGFCGPVGDDTGKETITRALKSANIAEYLVTIKNAGTGRYVSMLEPDGSLRLACNDMQIHDMFDAHCAEVALEPVLAKAPEAIFCDTNISLSTLELIWKMFPDSLQCVTSVSPAKAIKLRAKLGRLDILFCNVVEAAALLGLSVAENTCETLATLLAATSVPRGIVSNGSHPLWYWENGMTGKKPMPVLDGIVDVTGAGDALAGGTLAGYLNGEPFGIAIDRGIAAAGKVLKVSGPWPG